MAKNIIKKGNYDNEMFVCNDQIFVLKDILKDDFVKQSLKLFYPISLDNLKKSNNFKDTIDHSKLIEDYNQLFSSEDPITIDIPAPPAPPVPPAQAGPPAPPVPPAPPASPVPPAQAGPPVPPAQAGPPVPPAQAGPPVPPALQDHQYHQHKQDHQHHQHHQYHQHKQDHQLF